MAALWLSCSLHQWQKKLRLRNEEEVLYKQIIIEGVLSIQAGDNPKYLREKLLSYLPLEQKKNVKKRSTGADSGDFDV
jgi:chemotaxis protein MotA